MKYRPVAPDDIDRVCGELKRLAAETVLPWHFDEKSGGFYVEIDDQKHPVTFGPEDAETRFIELITANLPLLLDAVEKKFVLVDREWICQIKSSP